LSQPHPAAFGSKSISVVKTTNVTDFNYPAHQQPTPISDLHQMDSDDPRSVARIALQIATTSENQSTI
jgi:hypothetical protein